MDLTITELAVEVLLIPRGYLSHISEYLAFRA